MPAWDDSPNARQLQHLEQALGLPQAGLTRQWLDDELLALWLMTLENPELQMDAAAIGRFWQTLPYWAFAWAGGRGLARFIQQNPQHLVGRRVLDFGCGSAIAGVAAAIAGADAVYVCDLDPNALQAAAVNAALNGIELIPVRSGEPWPEVDLLLAADVLYDNSSHDPLAELTRRIPELLLAETRGMTPAVAGIRCLETLETSTLPAIGDFDQAVTVDVYGRLHGAPALN
ncbi:MAG: protein methyltransferase [Oceanospirillaceae bacterium]|nr:protein methyltransferase [Oceanospirillaceae bacterium]|tara:strand:+ start:2623 stop:3312 length:690 start_codon:yes stop_codon:yes gene_type:complete